MECPSFLLELKTQIIFLKMQKIRKIAEYEGFQNSGQTDCSHARNGLIIYTKTITDNKCNSNQNKKVESCYSTNDT